MQCQLRSRSCFARPVEANNQNSRLLFDTKRLRIAAEERGQFVVENFYDLLTRRNAAKHSFPERFFFYAGNEFSGDLKIDIRFKQRHAHLAQRGIDVRLADDAMPTEIFENLLKFVAKLWKHSVI